ncbi:MAG: hypothetical protein OEZ09_13310 [Betaproteobacteria bacterium]|nr:hypothetical protein [Betaproteobacteria bacterium]
MPYSLTPAAQATTLRIGAALALLSAVATVLSGALHPSQEKPDDHPRVFAEYAQSDIWVTGHLIQTYGFFLAFLALISLGLSLAERHDRARVFVRLGTPLATAAIAAAAILQGLDAVALKAVTAKWAAAADADRSPAFAAAEAVRYLEIGFNSTFRMLQGFCYVTFGAALIYTSGWARWLGWVGVAIGVAIVVRGFAVAYTGFSPANPLYAVVGGVALELLNVWLLVASAYMWRSASSLQGESSSSGSVSRERG